MAESPPQGSRGRAVKTASPRAGSTYVTPIFSLFPVCPGLCTLPGGIKPAPRAGERGTGSEAGSKLPKDAQHVGGGAVDEEIGPLTLLSPRLRRRGAHGQLGGLHPPPTPPTRKRAQVCLKTAIRQDGDHKGASTALPEDRRRPR
ncbi:hypothetical protein R6Z07F_013591 [Ovis aries]